jgi:hypothetical protein
MRHAGVRAALHSAMRDARLNAPGELAPARGGARRRRTTAAHRRARRIAVALGLAVPGYRRPSAIGQPGQRR